MHSTNDLNDGYIGSGKRLWVSIKKHGELTHFRQILEFWPDRESLKKRERELVNEDLLSDPMCMNIALGGGSWDHCNRNSDLQREKNLKSQRARKHLRENDPEWNRCISGKISESLKQAYREGRKKVTIQSFEGKTHTEETKQKMRLKARNRTGDKNSSYGSKWMSRDGVSRKINSGEISSFLKEGWTFGRRMNA